MASVAVAGALAATMTLTACSSSKGSGNGAGGTGNTQTGAQSPQQAVFTAFDNLGKDPGVRLVLSLPLSVSQIQDLGKSTSSTTLPAAEAQALSTGSLFFSFTTGHGEALDSQQARTDKENSLDFGLTIGSNTPLELRYTGQALYVHAQIAQLLSDVGQSNNASAAKIASTLQTADRYVPGLGALGQGKWVEINQQSLQSLQPFIKQLEQSGSPSGTTISQAEVSSVLGQLETDVKSALKSNATFAQLGNTGGRTEYSSTINASGFATAILPKLQQDLSSVPGLGSITSGDVTKAQQSIKPGQTAVVDVYVSDNKLSEADLDVSQFMKTNKPSFPVPLRLAIDNPGTISAPSGAVQLDLSKLPALLQGLLGGSTSTSGTSPASTG